MSSESQPWATDEAAVVRQFEGVVLNTARRLGNGRWAGFVDDLAQVGRARVVAVFRRHGHRPEAVFATMVAVAVRCAMLDEGKRLARQDGWGRGRFDTEWEFRPASAGRDLEAQVENLFDTAERIAGEPLSELQRQLLKAVFVDDEYVTEVSRRLGVTPTLSHYHLKKILRVPTTHQRAG